MKKVKRLQRCLNFTRPILARLRLQLDDNRTMLVGGATHPRGTFIYDWSRGTWSVAGEREREDETVIINGVLMTPKKKMQKKH